MKNFKLLILIFFLPAFCLGINAQEPLKIGHVTTVDILQALPASDSAQTLLEKDRKDFESMLEQMDVEYNRVVEDYKTNLSGYSQVVRDAREAEILDMQDKIQTFRNNASLQLQQRNMELFQPIYDKLQKAIDRVASQLRFTYILDVSKGSVVYISASSQAIDSLVLKELGVGLPN